MTASSEHYGIPAALWFTVAAIALRGRWLAAIISAFALLFSYHAALAWQLDIDSGIKCPADQVFDGDSAEAAAVDPGGNVVAGGKIGTHVAIPEPGDECGVLTGFAVVKIGPLGNKLWQFVIDDPELVGRVDSVAIDSAGNIFAVGSIFDTNIGTNFFTVVKLDPNGNELWRHLIKGSAPTGSNRANDVAVDTNGNVVAVGILVNIGTSFDFAVIEWDTNGVQLWSEVIDGSGTSLDGANAVAVDSGNNVIAAGRLEISGQGPNLAVISFDPDGNENWHVYDDRGGNEVAEDVAVDSYDDVVAVGKFGDAAGDFGVVKIDRDGINGDGSVQWQFFVSGAGGQWANSLDIDNQDNIVVTGTTRSISSPISNDFTVLKLDLDGTLVWRTDLDGSAGGYDEGKSVVVDSNDDVIATGYLQAGEPSGDIEEFPLVKLASVSGDTIGEIIWQSIVEGTAESPNPAGVRGDGNSAAVDLGGNAIAVGVVVNEETLEDFTIAKLNGADGADYDPIGDLIGYVIGQNFTPGVENSLLDKLNAALRKLEDANPDNDDAMVSNLRDFETRVEAQRGKKISEEQANEMVEAAEEIIAIYENAAASS